ncbi:MAG: glycosyltransferase [Endomicrobiales bacterium]
MAEVDVVIITARRAQCLERCVESAVRSGGAGIIVIVNGHDEETGALLEKLSRKHPPLTVLTEKLPVPKSRARNTGLRASKADIVYFIDDDAFVREDTIAAVKRKFEQYPGIAAAGGPNITPPQSALFQRLAGYVLSSPFTAWRMKDRFSRGHRDSYCDDAKLTLCNLALRRDVLAREGIDFDERLKYNEENLLLQQLKARGYRMLYSPELVVCHERRETSARFLRQVYESGRGRGLMTVIMPESFAVVYAMPSLLCAYLALLLFLRPPWLLVPLSAYLFFDIINAVSVSLSSGEGPGAAAALAVLSPLAHVAYGGGFIRGLLKAVLWKTKHSR